MSTLKGVLLKMSLGIIGLVMILFTICVFDCNNVEAKTIYDVEMGDYICTVYEDDKTLSVDYYKGTERVLVIPSEINGYKVVQMNSVCYQDTTLEQVIIPDTIDEIHEFAFYRCVNLKSVVLPKRLKRIGESAFAGCIALQSIELPDTVTEIQKDAFYNCDSLKSIKLPDSLTVITEEMLAHCDNLNEIVIGDSVTSIEKNAFWACIGMTDLTLPENLISCSGSAFSACRNLKELIFPDSLSELSLYTQLPEKASYYAVKDSKLYNELKNAGLTAIPKIDVSTLSIKNVENMTEYKYTGKWLTPEVAVKKEDIALVNQKEYKVLYKNNQNIGTAEISVYGVGKYTGNKTLTFDIIPGKTTGVIQSGQSDDTLKLQWQSVAGQVSGYEIYRYNKSLGVEKKLIVSKNTITDSGLNPSTEYSYKIRAYKNVNNKIYYGKFSDLISGVTVPSKVLNFRWVESKADQISLKWDKPKNKVTGYKIYKYSSEKGTFVLLNKNFNSSRISWTNSYLRSNTEYRYKIRPYITYNGKNYFGDLSDEIRAVTAPTAPRYQLTSDKKGEINITWDSVDGATGYVLFYKTDADDTWKALTNRNFTGNSYTKKNLTSGQKYYFYLKAVNDYNGTLVKSSTYFKFKTAK